MKFISLLILPLFFNWASTGMAQSISIIDFVKVKDNRRMEALFYYENNWKVYRDIALKKGYIKSYKLLTTNADSLASFDLILITEYIDSAQHAMAEERFSQIIKEIRPNGPKLLNALKSSDFRQNLYYRRGKTLHEGPSE